MVVALVLLGCGFLLFLGGMLSAAREIHRERKAGVRVTRPAWNKEDRAALRADRGIVDYRAPRGTGLVIWPLVAVGRPDLAERFLRWRASRSRECWCADDYVCTFCRTVGEAVQPLGRRSL